MLKNSLYRFLHQTHQKIFFALLIFGTANFSFATDSYNPYGIKALTPGELQSFDPQEVYTSTQGNAYYFDSSVFEAASNFQTFDTLAESHNLMQQSENFMQQLDLTNPEENKILAEWQSMKTELETMLQKRSEVDELLNYITNLSKASENEYTKHTNQCDFEEVAKKNLSN